MEEHGGMVVQTHRLHDFPRNLTRKHEQMHDLQVDSGLVHS
jgi:hypothetical protein